MKNNKVFKARKLHNCGIDSENHNFCDSNSDFTKIFDGLGVASNYMPKDLSLSNQLLFSNVNKLHLVMRVVDSIVTSHVGDKIHITCEPYDTFVDIYMGF